MSQNEDWHLIDDLLLATNKHKASDLLVRTHDRVRMRINGSVITIAPDKIPPPGRDQVIDMIKHMTRKMIHKPDIESLCNIDFQYSLENVCHFRIHVLRTNDNYGIVARVIPKDIPNFEDLRSPPVLREICKYRNGLILMAGATGSGKSTTMAAMLNHIIETKPVHVVTIEDPMEFRYSTDKKGTVSQRQLGNDVTSYTQGLNDALREAPDIIVAGEARDREVIQLALQAAETGHLVMATVHATSAVGTMQRIMSAFGLDEQEAIRERLSENLRAIIVQKLIPLKEGKGRIAAQEIMIRNAVIKHYILDPDRWREIPKAMEEGINLYGSQSFDQHLQKLVERDVITYEEGYAAATFQEDFAMRLGREP
ncbi:MAG: twitching motility protein PilT [Zetaproteobacteria bacterium CG1_02_49_23]|nr:MAG: twitching motility protein PilT [Zetaproteobacteria bacterium CG1_02_49_23]